MTHQAGLPRPGGGALRARFLSFFKNLQRKDHVHSKIIKELKRRANGDRRAQALWCAYVSFLEGCPALDERAAETSVHHILWQAEYPQYSKSKWNLIRLSNIDHAAATALALAAEPNKTQLLCAFFMVYRRARIMLAWKPPSIPDFIDLYKSGRSSHAIAAKFGVSCPTVLLLLRKNNVRIRTAGDARSWKPKDPEKVIQLYKKGKSLSFIGRKYSKVHCAVKRFLLRNKAPLRVRGINRSKQENAIKLYKEGKSAFFISKKYKVSMLYIKQLILSRKMHFRGRAEASVLREYLQQK
jgi:hypothetical protein